ncbi:MAG: hypothetical protein HEEMFOPI_01567 [Holosporales bacterium]
MYILIFCITLGAFSYAATPHLPVVSRSEPINNASLNDTSHDTSLNDGSLNGKSHDASLNDTSIEVANIMEELQTPAAYPPPRGSFLPVSNVKTESEHTESHTDSASSHHEDAFGENSFFGGIPRVESETESETESVTEDVIIDTPAPDLPHFDQFIPRRGALRNPPEDSRRSQDLSRSQDASHERRSLSISQKLSQNKAPLNLIPAKELSFIPKVAPVLPSECTQKFKNVFVSCSGILSMVALVLSRLSYIASGVILSDYGLDLNYIALDTRTKIIVLAGISGFVFDHIKQVLQLARLRDELYLISYERKKEDNARRLENGENNFFSRDEIIEYLKTENEFACLPQKRELKFRKFALNSMCILESFLGIGVSFFSGFSAMFITSGTTSSNVVGLSSDENRKLMILFSTITAAMMALEYYQVHLKKMCEHWIQNYERLYFYFVYMCDIPKKDVMKEVRYVPLNLLSKKIQSEIQKVDHVAINMPQEGA